MQQHVMSSPRAETSMVMAPADDATGERIEPAGPHYEKEESYEVSILLAVTGNDPLALRNCLRSLSGHLPSHEQVRTALSGVRMLFYC